MCTKARRSSPLRSRDTKKKSVLPSRPLKVERVVARLKGLEYDVAIRLRIYFTDGSHKDHKFKRNRYIVEARPAVRELVKRLYDNAPIKFIRMKDKDYNPYSPPLGYITTGE